MGTRIRIRLYGSVGGLLARRGWRGLSWLRRHAIDSLDADYVVVALSEDAVFRFKLKDFYWNRLLLRGFVYESPLASLLRHLRSHEYNFIDCGANLGLWSILVSSKDFGSKSAVAIEAYHRNYELLLENCRLNRDRFLCCHGAVHSHSGRTIEIFANDSSHYGASMDAAWHAARSQGMVETTTIDEVSEKLGVAPGNIVVKLDVEGSEVEALVGAANTLRNGALLVYEDHPRDTLHRATDHLLREDMRVWLIGEGGFVPIPDTMTLAREKVRRNYEYNLAAVRRGSSFESLFGN